MTKVNLPARHDDGDGHRLWWLRRMPTFHVEGGGTLQAGLRRQRVQTRCLVHMEVRSRQWCLIARDRWPRLGLLRGRCVARAGRGFGSGPVEEHEWDKDGHFPGPRRRGEGLAPPTTRAPR
jgi:hypothetical protein